MKKTVKTLFWKFEFKEEIEGQQLKTTDRILKEWYLS